MGILIHKKTGQPYQITPGYNFKPGFSLMSITIPFVESKWYDGMKMHLCSFDQLRYEIKFQAGCDIGWDMNFERNFIILRPKQYIQSLSTLGCGVMDKYPLATNRDKLCIIT